MALKQQCKNGHLFSVVGVTLDSCGRRRCAKCYALYKTEYKERHAVACKIWRKRNRLSVLTSEAKRRRKPARLLYTYKRNAAKRSIEFLLSDELFIRVIGGDCHYCGISNAGGVDRKDNTRGYTDDNSVSCCWTCNRMKTDMPPSEFVAQAQRIAEHTMRKCPHGVRIPDGDSGDKSVYCSGCYSPQSPAVPKADDDDYLGREIDSILNGSKGV